MKTRIFGLILAVVMLVSAIMMTGCSYTFRGEDYSEELGGILTADSYKNLAVEVNISADDDKFLTAKETGEEALAAYVTTQIANGMREFYYTDSDGKKVYFTGTNKLGSATTDNDVRVYYYVTAKNGTEEQEVIYTNLISNAGLYQLGSGNLIGKNFDKWLANNNVTAGMGSLTRLTVINANKEEGAEDQKLTQTLIDEGFNVLLIKVEATYDYIADPEKPDEVTEKTYNGHSGEVLYRFDLSLIDTDTKALKPEYEARFGYMTQYKSEFIDAVLSAMESGLTAGIPTGDSNSTAVKTIAIDNTDDDTDNAVDYDVTFTVTLQDAQKEEFYKDADDNIVYAEFEADASNTKVPLLTGDVKVMFIVEQVREYTLESDLTEYMTLAKIENFKTVVQKLDSSFTTEATEKADIIKAYRDHYVKSTNDRIDAEISASAQAEMLDLILAKIPASFDAYPSSAVDDTYDEMYNNYKYTYKTSETGYASLEEYITNQEGAADYEDAKASMLAKAKAIVLEKMVVIHTANVLGITVTEDDYEAKRAQIVEQNFIYIYLYGMSEDDIIDSLAGGEDGVYLAVYYNRAMEKVYNDNKANVKVTVAES